MNVGRRVSLLTLGCARNDVDSEELAAGLTKGGWSVTAATGSESDPADADVVVVNTCGFIDAAKAESIETVLGLAGHGTPVVAVGCLAERYGRQLAEELPEAAAVVGFDGYASLPQALAAVVKGERIPSHQPVDRRAMLPVSPTLRPVASGKPGSNPATPPALMLPDAGTAVLRRRLTEGPVAPLKIASGCDRRCAFCAIPAFRGAFVSRPPDVVLAEAEWLAGQGVSEIVLVSENSTSYGKDLDDPRLLERLLARLGDVPGILRVRLSYLQPAELRPSLIDVIVETPAVADYFDISFQHASGDLLRRMRRFGDAEQFLGLIYRIRAVSPSAGIRTNVIVGFPGETEADIEELREFLAAAGPDAVGVFGYSDEAGTEGARLHPKLDADEIRSRVADLASTAELVTNARAESRPGTPVDVLVASHADGRSFGRAAHQGAEDGECALTGELPIGSVVPANVTAAEGVDLRCEVDRGAVSAGGAGSRQPRSGSAE